GFPIRCCSRRVEHCKRTISSFGTCLARRGARNFAKEYKRMSAQENQVALPLRSHTILGVCEAIGEDFGFNPVWLRIPLAASVIWNPAVAFGAYFGLGA